MEVRPFRNTDPPQLVRLWKEHHAACGIELPLTATTLENCVLSKPYFDADGLLLAMDAGKPVGMIHVGLSLAHENSTAIDGLGSGGLESSFLRYEDGQVASFAATSSNEHPHGVLSALCVPPRSDDQQIAEVLLAAAKNYLQQQGVRTITTNGPAPHVPFYLGIAAGDGLIGIDGRDNRLQNWLLRAGYSSWSMAECLELDLNAFRVPMDRIQIQIRRQGHVDRLLAEPDVSWWLASVLGHTERLGFQLTLRQRGVVDASILLWQHDSGATGFHSPAARLWPVALPEPEDARERLLFLLGEAFRQLQQDRIPAVRTVALSSQQPLVQLLLRLGFWSNCMGMIYQSQI